MTVIEQDRAAMRQVFVRTALMAKGCGDNGFGHWILGGSKVQADPSDEFFGVVAISPRDNDGACELRVIALEDCLLVHRDMRSSVTHAVLPPEALIEYRLQEAEWRDVFDHEVRARAIELAHQLAYIKGVPLCFVAFRRDHRQQSYMQFWHTPELPPSVCFEALRRLLQSAVNADSLFDPLD